MIATITYDLLEKIGYTGFNYDLYLDSFFISFFFLFFLCHSDLLYGHAFQIYQSHSILDASFFLQIQISKVYQLNQIIIFLLTFDFNSECQ